MTSENRRVLVVDDDQNTRRILVSAMRQKSLVIDEAAGGREAIELLREHTYSVVVLDLLMPEVNGFGVLDFIDETAASAPVVLVVSGADRNVLEELDSRRVHGIIRKPFMPQEVADVVAACTEIRNRSAFETMALATMMTGAPLMALLKL
ncbi:MAG: response regulator [Acidobacteriota bacterium]|nr:response regulator [Acidobacteriota bacterium]